MNLWKANIFLDFDVMVASEEESKFKFDVEEVISDFRDLIKIRWTKIQNYDNIPEKWLNCVPYGDNKNTIGEIISETSEELRKKEIFKKMDKNQLKLDI